MSSGSRPNPGKDPYEGSVPRDRYGKARVGSPLRGWRLWAFVTMCVLLGGMIAWIAYQNLGSAPIETNRASFRQLPGNALEFTFTVQRDQPQNDAVCIVRVRSEQGVETGRREVLVPPGDTTITTVIKSTKPPVTANVVGCSYDIPNYMSTSRTRS